jgi:hypothetical protein
MCPSSNTRLLLRRLPRAKDLVGWGSGSHSWVATVCAFKQLFSELSSSFLSFG